MLRHPFEIGYGMTFVLEATTERIPILAPLGGVRAAHEDFNSPRAQSVLDDNLLHYLTSVASAIWSVSTIFAALGAATFAARIWRAYSPREIFRTGSAAGRMMGLSVHSALMAV